jgi:hypothetical protein
MRTIQIYQPNEETGVLEMRLPGGTLSEYSGVQVLLQNIALFLKTKPGSDVFSPERGTILGDTAARAKALTNLTQLKVLITDAVDQCQIYIMNQQEAQRQMGQVIEPDATLNKLVINNIYQGDDPTTVYVEVLVYTESNKQYFITV